MSDIIKFPGVTKLDIPVDTVLNKALESNLKSTVVLGWEQDGEGYYASSIAEGAEILWLLESMKYVLLRDSH